jgi:hypothetical protein
MAQIVIGVAGAIVGGMIGGPFGAAKLGMAIGWSIGISLGAPTQKVEGPRLEKLKAPDLVYGSQWPRLYGRMRITPKILWADVPTEHATTTTQGGKGGGGVESTTYSYTTNVLFGFVEGTNAIGITRIWRAGELIYSMLADSNAVTLAASANSEHWTALRFYDGNPAQLPDPVYEAAVGTANAIAYRHRGTAFIEGLQLGGTDQLPMLEFEVITSGTPSSQSALTRLQAGAPADADESYYANGTPEANGEFGSYVYQHINADIAGDATTARLFEGFFSIAAAAGSHSTILVVGYSPFQSLGNGDVRRILITSSGGDMWIAYDDAGFGSTPLLLAEAGSYHYAMQWGPAGSGVWINGIPYISIAGDATPNSDAEGRVELQPDGTASPWVISIGEYRVRAEEVYTIGAAFTPPTSLDPPDLPLDLLAPTNVDLDDVVSAECLRAGLSAGDIDVTALAATSVTGFAAMGSARQCIEPLMAGYYFVAVCSDKLYFRLRGGASAATIPFASLAAGIDQATETPLDWERANPLELPMQASVTYINIDADYESGVETNDRLTAGSTEVRTLQLPIVFTPSEAKGRAQTMLFDAITEGQASGTVTLNDYYAAIEPTDVVTLTDDDASTYRVRFVRERYAAGVKELEWVLDDANVLTTSGIAGATTEPVIDFTPLGDAELVLLDIPILRDADDDPGLYGAAHTVGGALHGTAVLKSVDDVSFTTRSADILEQAVFGMTTTGLQAWTGGYVWDEISSVTVDVGDGTLSSSTQDAMQADRTINAAAISIVTTVDESDNSLQTAWEIIRFRTATLVSPGVYTLTGLLRGERGTEWIARRDLHAAGNKFVLLTAAGMRRLAMEADEVSQVRYWKGVTIGRLLSTAESQSARHQAVGKVPLSPTNVRGSRDVASGDWTITWNRRTRLLPRYGGTGGNSIPLGEDAESYEVRIYDAATWGAGIKRVLTSATESVVYTSSQQGTDWGSNQSTIFVGVTQLSGTLGRGPYYNVGNGLPGNEGPVYPSETKVSLPTGMPI